MLILVETRGLHGIIPDGFRRELEYLKLFHTNVESNYAVKAYAKINEPRRDPVITYEFDLSIVVGDNPEIARKCPIPCVWMPFGTLNTETAKYCCGVITRTTAEQKALNCDSTMIRHINNPWLNVKMKDVQRTFVCTEAPYGSGPHLEVIESANACDLPVEVSGFPLNRDILEQCGKYGRVMPTISMLKHLYCKSKVFVCANNHQRHAAYEALACGCRVLAHESVLMSGDGISKYDDNISQKLIECYNLPEIVPQPTGNPDLLYNYLKKIVGGLI